MKNICTVLLLVTSLCLLVSCTTWPIITSDRIADEVAVNDHVKVAVIGKRGFSSFVVEAIEDRVLIGEGHRIPFRDIRFLKRKTFDVLYPVKRAGLYVLYVALFPLWFPLWAGAH